MLIDAQKEITRVSENEMLNMQNYMESLSYVSNLYDFLNKLKSVLPDISDIDFLPSFYGRLSCTELLRADSPYSDKEAELKVLRLSSPLFFVDNTAKDIMKKMKTLCEEIRIEDGIMTFILK